MKENQKCAQATAGWLERRVSYADLQKEKDETILSAELELEWLSDSAIHEVRASDFNLQKRMLEGVGRGTCCHTTTPLSRTSLIRTGYWSTKRPPSQTSKLSKPWTFERFIRSFEPAGGYKPLSQSNIKYWLLHNTLSQIVVRPTTHFQATDNPRNIQCPAKNIVNRSRSLCPWTLPSHPRQGYWYYQVYSASQRSYTVEGVRSSEPRDFSFSAVLIRKPATSRNTAGWAISAISNLKSWSFETWMCWRDFCLSLMVKISDFRYSVYLCVNQS